VDAALRRRRRPEATGAHPAAPGRREPPGTHKRLPGASRALLAFTLAAISACTGNASPGSARAVKCLPGETCGYAARTHRSANCCGFALGPFPDAISCRNACEAQAAAVGRAGLDCVATGKRQCDAASDDWSPCSAATGATESSGRCILASGLKVSCVCR
jgi:hypothetical protein